MTDSIKLFFQLIFFNQLSKSVKSNHDFELIIFSLNFKFSTFKKRTLTKTNIFWIFTNNCLVVNYNACVLVCTQSSAIIYMRKRPLSIPMLSKEHFAIAFVLNTKKREICMKQFYFSHRLYSQYLYMIN